MTLEDISRSMPNGFHDAELVRLEADFSGRKLQLTMNIDVSAPGEHSDEHFRRAEVKLSGVCYWFLESPDHHYKPWLQDQTLAVNGYVTKSEPKILERFPAELLNATPATAFLYSFFIDDWNTFLHIAAESAECSWSDSSTANVK